MSSPAVQQVISALEVILGKDGSNRGKYFKAVIIFLFYVYLCFAHFECKCNVLVNGMFNRVMINFLFLLLLLNEKTALNVQVCPFHRRSWNISVLLVHREDSL